MPSIDDISTGAPLIVITPGRVVARTRSRAAAQPWLPTTTTERPFRSNAATDVGSDSLSSSSLNVIVCGDAW